MLPTDSFEVEAASSGKELLEKVRFVHPDIILLDAMMEGMDGYEVCQALKEDERLDSVPVLMVTGLDDVDAVQRAFDVGASGFTSKPVSYPLLTQHIRFQLRAKRNEMMLRERQLQIESAQRLAHLGHWRWDLQSGAFEVSPHLVDMCGMEQGVAWTEYSQFMEYVSSHDRARVEAILEKACYGHAVDSIEFHLRGRDGRQLQVQQAIEIQCGASGEKTLLGVIQDVTHLRAMECQLRSMAFYDSLTGLPNRVLFLSRLEEMMSLAKRNKDEFSLLFLDLDSFKDVNDSLGHDVGDELLKEVAHRLEEATREEDFVVRLGGDEFCILSADAGDGLDAAGVASRCIQKVNEPVELTYQLVRPQISIGIARFPEDGDTPTALLKAADSAMYAAKEAGKNDFAFYQQEMTQAAEKRLSLEEEIRTAINRGEFILYYQPQVHLDSGRCMGVEALVRWQHPERGIIGPNEFIPMVERMGLIDQLGGWVMREACRQAGAWMRAGHVNLKMAVNVSPLQLGSSSLYDEIAKALANSGLPPEQLQVEVTESAVQDGSDLIDALYDLQKMGAKIAIDDFGTGYSALGSLKKMPVDTLKIDRSFICDMLRDSNDTIVLGTIVGLAHAMQYCLVAEGVEDLDQLKVLHALGVDMVQGYYLSHPVPAEALTDLLDEDFFQLSARNVSASVHQKAG